MRSLTIALSLAGAACTMERELGSLSVEESAVLYSSMKAQLRTVHDIALAGQMPPARYEYGCSSGTIDVKISLDEMLVPVALRHAFEGCASDGLMLDGAIAYREIDFNCSDGESFEVSVGGRIDVGGDMNGYCFIETRDNCGRLSGYVCGHPAEDIGAVLGVQ